VSERVDLFYNTYGHFGDPVLRLIRRDTFGEDIGQNSWVTVDEYDRFISWLGLSSSHHVLEIASGCGCAENGIGSCEMAIGRSSPILS